MTSPNRESPGACRHQTQTPIIQYFLLISVVPAFNDAINPGEIEDHRWFGALFSGVHTMFINPIVTISSILVEGIQFSHLHVSHHAFTEHQSRVFTCLPVQ